MKVQAYISYRGRCEEALEFYKNSIGAEVTGLIGDEIHTQDIFTFMMDRTAAGGSIEGTFSASGVIPQIVETWRARGTTVESAIFSRPPPR